MNKPTERPDRFWTKVDKTETCWLWTGHVMRNGYGQAAHDGRTQLAHRVAFLISVGPIAEGQEIDHICYNRACVNPAHLQAVTHQQNNENPSRLRVTNRSGVRGVSWDKKNSKWRVTVVHDYRTHSGGRYSSLADAEAAAIALRNALMTNNLQDREVSAA